MSDPKDRWDKLEILLKPTGSIVAGVLVAVIGLMGKSFLEERARIEAKAQAESQRQELNARLLAELINSREEAESSLRAQMFGQILQTLLTSPSDLARDVLNMELLAENFHESLNLAPLFKAVHFEIWERLSAPERADSAGPEPDSEQPVNLTESQLQDLLGRLERVAKEVVGQQVIALKASQNSIDMTVSFDELKDPGVIFEPISNRQILSHWFSLEILRIYEEKEKF